MKGFILFITILLLTLAVEAQKIIEGQIGLDGKKSTYLKIKIADSIKILGWNKNEISYKAIIDVNDNKDNDKYVIKTSENLYDVFINADFDTTFSKATEGHTKNNDNIHIYWVVNVPDHVKLSIETINGNIVITNKGPEIIAFSISGIIDLTFTNKTAADITMNTITGTIFSNFDVINEGLDKSSNALYNISFSQNGGGNPIRLKTISGDIFLRKEK